MHLLATSSASLDSLIEPIDLAQPPAELVALSFTDSDLASLAHAWKADADTLPSLRVAALRDLRHPMSVDLWIENTARKAKTIVARVLGGYDWWSYGCDALAEIARRDGIALALLPGECRERDERLAGLSTVSGADYDLLLGCFREGGPSQMAAALRHMARFAGRPLPVETPAAMPRAGLYVPAVGIVEQNFFAAAAGSGKPVVPLFFYRSMLLAGDVAPIDALADALAARHIVAVPIFVNSLQDPAARELATKVARELNASLLLTTTAFSAGAAPGAETLFDALDLPVFQVALATTRRDVWEAGQRGLAPADLAMHVVLPELDGRIMAGAISFKQPAERDEALGARLQVNRPEPDRVERVADRIASFIALQRTPPAERCIAILIPDYPAATGRSGYAVGLDVPNSVLAMLADLKAQGYVVTDVPETSRDLMRALETARPAMTLGVYRDFLATLPETARVAIDANWGAPETDAVDGHFAFRHMQFGNVTVALAPDRGRSGDRRVDYHDPVRPPRHALVAFGGWLRTTLGCHAIVHVGAHGTLEWLPGKSVALSQSCFPEIVAGALPVVYPFIVSNPGEAAQAKRRLAAVALGHLTPALNDAGLSPDQQKLERLVDEYAQAEGLDRRRRDRLASLIVETASRTGLAREAGVADDGVDAALVKIDAWLCDLKDFAVKDGLHIYGRAPADEMNAARRECAEAERHALIASLDGRRVAPGPSGAPSRGRTDVMPTGRNLFTSDPRTLPTPTATALGRLAAAEIVRLYLQEHGDYPRALVLDLWGSASLRTGGEEIAQGLALMGCRPQWDEATGRVVGIEVLPPAVLDHPRIDVTWRISGLFRDMFPTQIALIDAAVCAIAARDESDHENPLAAARRRDGTMPARIFGSAPGTYGSGVEERLAGGDWQAREELGRAYLDAASHAYGGADGEGTEAAGAFADRVADVNLLVHVGDDAGRDILEGSADVAFVGGFAAAAAALGGKADVIMLDTTRPERPRGRSVVQAVTRTVRARALNATFIEGQLRHGHRGAAEFAETVDRLVGFAETTAAIPETLLDDVHDAYLGDPRVREFLLRENPAAARAIAERFAAARRRGLWHPRRNAIDEELAALIEEARGLEAA